MRAVFFSVGFAAVMIPAADSLASMDPEPDMAGLSLLFFGLLALLASAGAFFWSAARSRVEHGKIMVLCAGVACAIGFYAVLGFTHAWLAELGLLPVLGLSIAAALFVAWALPLRKV